MNQFLQTQSRITLDDIQKVLAVEIKNPENLKSPENLSRLAAARHITEFQLFNLYEKYFLFPESPYSWEEEDNKAVEESIRNKAPYYIRVYKQKWLAAYIPLEGRSAGEIWIARIIFSLTTMKDALSASRWTLGIILILIAMIGSVIGIGLAKSIVGPIRKLNEGAQRLMDGQLGAHVNIHTGDEIEALAVTFNKMSDTIRAMKQKAEEANPLTHLPGNERIFQEINKRIHERQKFVLFHIDLDRFKVFNDHFGLARGDMAIKKTAETLNKVVAEKGTSNDFVGHHGGDDFVIITRPNHAKEVGEQVCRRFESDVLSAVYSKEDLRLGYTLHQDRRRLTETGENVMVKFPLLSISLAGVSNTKRDFADYFDCMSAAVKVKAEVKRNVRSNYLIQE